MESSLLDMPEESYRVRLDVFEGPLDLLLHLIRKNKVSIFDIPVALILSQYLEFLDLMRELNLRIAGEFLEMAATLAYIKSRMLLPRHADEEDEEEDPRMDLVTSLMEYARIKEITKKLSSRFLLERDVFGRGAPIRAGPGEDQEFEAGLFELTSAFVELMKRAETTPPMEVEMDAVSLRRRMVELLSQVKRHAQSGLTFRKLIEGLSSRIDAVFTFLAVLELMRLGAIKAFQHEPSAIIRIFPGPRAWVPLPLVEDF